MNTDIQEILNKLFSYEPTRPTGYAHALSLGNASQGLKALVWRVCRFNEDINLFYNLEKNYCFFRDNNEKLDKSDRYFVARSSNSGYGCGIFLLPKLGTILLSEKEIVVPNSMPDYGSCAVIDEKEKLFQGRFNKKDSCSNNYFLDIFIPNFSERYHYWNHYVLSISKYSLFLSKFEFENKKIS